MNMEGDGTAFAGTLRRLGGDQGLFQDLAEFYCEDSPALLQEIRAGLEAGNIPRVQRAAHRLRSMLENFDVERAVAITRTMEQTCGRGELPLLPTALTQLQDDMEALSRALRRYTRTLREEILHDGGRGEPTHIVHRAR